MARQEKIAVNLLFQANTASAIKNLETLGKILNDISTNTAIGFNSSGIEKSVLAAQQLQVHLENAVNVDTGKLDLVKLNNSLKIAKTDLKSLTTDLKALGPVGEQAFIKIATAISSAETPTVRFNKQITEFGKTLLNTVKWQAASTAIHGVSGMLSSAVRHAEDLNGALSDIRIVTGASSTEMAVFAKQASAAARELNTTTTEYAKAALIFYQQGLSGSEVSQRADTVVKLAQVTGQSAKMVSDQMTAIWNNFDNGTKSLEYYADVLTKLGAITAASTDEISDGLEKFAAVAETVGLEYETAAAAVATVVDKTRQSADVVGTSFKTIFARIQSLSLGETLDDGVTLTKYSEALEKVGVDVLDASGKMRDMDQILSDLGDKWAGMGESAKIAVAQTVGGIRQYNQMMALMNNWTDVEKNMDAAAKSSGELNKQAQIWSESQEAAQQRLKQAQNELYETFLNNDAIAKVTDVFAELVNNINIFVDSVGGGIPILLTFVGLFSKFLFPAIRNGFNELIQNLKVLSGEADRSIAKMQDQMHSMMNADLANTGISDSLKKQIELSIQLMEAKRKLAAESKHMSAAERVEAEMRMSTYEALVAETQSRLEKQKVLEDEIKKMSAAATEKSKIDIGKQSATEYYKSAREVGKIGISDTKTYDMETEAVLEMLDQYSSKKDVEEEIKKIQAELDTTKPEPEKTKTVKISEEDKITKMLNDVKSGSTEAQEALEETVATTDKITVKTKEEVAALEEKLKILRQVADVQQKGVEFGSKRYDQQKEVVGQTKSTNFVSMDSTEEVRAISDSIGTSVAKDIGGQYGNGGSMQASVSMESFEKTLHVTAEYTAALSRLQTTETAFNNIEVSLTEARAKLSTITEKAIENTEEMTEAVEEATKVEKDANKANSSTEKTQKTSEKTSKAAKKAKTEEKKAIEEYNTAVTRMAKNMGASVHNIVKDLNLSSDATKEFDTALEAIVEQGDTSETAVNALNNAFQNLKDGIANTQYGLTDLSDGMGSTLYNAGILSEETLNGMQEKCGELAEEMTEAGIKSDIAAGALENLGNNAPSAGDKFEEFGTKIASGVGWLQSLYGSIGMITSAFDEGNTPLETFMGFVGGLAILVPALAAALKALGLSTAFATGVEKLYNNTLGKLIAVISKKTAVTWADTSANIANTMSQFPAGTIAAAAILAAIVGVTASLAIHTKNVEADTKALEKNHEQKAEAAESALEAADAWLEQSEAMDTAISAYRKLTIGTEEYEAAAQRVLDQIPNLVKSYRDYAKAIGETTEQGKELLDLANQIETAGNKGEAGIEEALKLQAEADVKIAQDSQKKAEEAKNSAFRVMTNAMGRAKDTYYEDNKVTRHVGGVGTKSNAVKTTIDGKEYSFNEEAASVDILMQAFGKGRNTKKSTGFKVSLDATNADTFIDDYEKLMKAATDMENTLGDTLDNSDTYREVKEMLDGSKAQYEELIKYQQEVDKYNAMVAQATLKKNSLNNGALDITKVSNVKQYETYKKALLEATGDDEEAQQQALEWLESQDSVSKYAKALNRAESLGGNLKDTIGTYDDTKLDYFLNVDTNVFATVSDIETEISRLQSEAKQNEIELQITATSDALDTLKETGMTEEDWTKIRESDIDWKEIGGIKDFSTFLSASYEEQKNYLEQLKIQQQSSLEDELETEALLLQNKIQQSGISKELKAQYEKELQITNEQLAVRKKMNDIEAENRKREKVEAFGFDIKEIKVQAQQLKTEYSLTEDAAFELALQNQRMNAGIIELSSNWTTWSTQLKTSEKGTAHYAQATLKATEAIGNLIGASEDFELPEGFLDTEEHLDLINEAAQGDIDSINQLGIAITQAQISKQVDTMNDSWVTFFTALGSMDVKTSLDSSYITALNEMSAATKMSVEDMINMLAQLGIAAEVTTDDNGNAIIDTSVDKDGKAKVPTFIGNGNTMASTATFEKLEDKDFTSRYFKEEEAIKQKNKALIKAERLMDSLYGKERISQIDEVNTALQNEISAIQEKNKAAKDNLKTDSSAVVSATSGISGLDVSVTTDNNGKITTDMSTVFDKLDEQYRIAQKAYNDELSSAESDGIITVAEEAELNALKKAADNKASEIEKVKAAWDKYCETLDIVNETDEKVIENQNKIKANNYKKITESLTLNLKDNALDIQEYDYYLNKYAEDVYNMSEGISKLQSKITSTEANLTDYGDHLDKLREAYANGEITETDYYAGLEKTRNAIYEQMEALNTLDKEMQNYYGDTLVKAGEEIGKYTDKIENLSRVLDHYQSLLTLIGKENDFQSMGVVLQGIAETAEDAKDAAKKEYEMYAQQATNRKAKYEEKLQANGGVENEETKMLKQQWEEAEKATAESQDRMLAKTAEWGEAMKAVVENNLKSYAKTLEDTLAGEYGSFDDMTTAMERKQSLNEEYLTTTNKIYETEKMMRATQKAIDETTNQSAKNRLKTFMEQTKELQQQDKLSEHELSLHQAEYELILAQIALEEAQSAKSTVRLQRDAEGNFGYVYTADSAQVADAEQKVADAQNALYNKQLEGANNYTQKYQQTLSEMYDTMSSLQEQYLSGEIATETEYNEKMTAAKEYYYKKLQDFSDLYTISTTGNSAVIADAWSADFADMTAQTETWKDAVETYSTNCSSAFTTWSGVISQIKQTTGEDLDKLTSKVNNITTASDNLKDALIGKDDEKGIIELMGDELTSVTTTTDAYAAQRDTLKTLITEYENYAEAISKVIKAKNANAFTDKNTDTSSGTETSDFIVGTSVKIKSSATKYADDFDIVATDKTKNYTIAKISEDKKSVLLKDDENNEKNWIKISDIEKLNTGGYTGEWGPEGKLAVLHEKEIVLNAQDTENLLAAVGTLRVILNAIDTHSMSAQIGGMLSTPGFTGGGSEVLEQTVKIEASFPGVQDRNEIEEAFNNLINRASQYANRK